MLERTVRLSGLDRSLSAALSGWRGRHSRHDPADMLISLAIAVAFGGDCAADIAVVRAQPQVFGSVASDPTVSRLIAALAADIEASRVTVHRRFTPSPTCHAVPTAVTRSGRDGPDLVQERGYAMEA